jgi:hypothetical protein
MKIKLEPKKLWRTRSVRHSFLDKFYLQNFAHPFLGIYGH